MKELLVLINGEIIRLPHRHQQLVGSAIARAFDRSTQEVGTNNRWRIEDRYGDPLSPADRVEYLEQIWVSLAPGPKDGGEVIEAPKKPSVTFA